MAEILWILGTISNPNVLRTTASTKTREITLSHEQPILLPNGLRHTKMSFTGKVSKPGIHDPTNCACSESILLNASSADKSIGLGVFSPYCRPGKHANAYVTCSFQQCSPCYQYCTFEALQRTSKRSGKKETHPQGMTLRLVSLCAENQASCVSSSRFFSPL